MKTWPFFRTYFCLWHNYTLGRKTWTFPCHFQCCFIQSRQLFNIGFALVIRLYFFHRFECIQILLPWYIQNVSNIKSIISHWDIEANRERKKSLLYCLPWVGYILYSIRNYFVQIFGIHSSVYQRKQWLIMSQNSMWNTLSILSMFFHKS